MLQNNSRNKLRAYQLAGVERLIELTAERHAAILADEPGLGKTLEVAEYINRTKPATVLIVCPASLRINWRRELDRWMVHQPSELYVFSYEKALGYIPPAAGLDLAVFDEAHYLKNPTAQRTSACLAIPARARLFLTGTPVVNRPIDLYPILKSCGLKMSKTDFGKRYCGGRLVCVRWRPVRKYAWDFSGSSNSEELAAALRKHVMVRRTKAEVLTELPPKIRQVVEMDIPSGESAKLKAAVTRMFDGLAQAAENVRELKRIAFEELSKERLAIARNKLSAVVEFVRDLLGEEEKVVVMAYHREIVEAIRDAFDGEAVLVYGGMTDHAKDIAVRSFQEDATTRVFVGQITAAGTGITLTAARTVVFAELDWVPGNVVQAEDRCHRIGQTDPVRIFHVVAKDSVDARMVRALVDKQNVIERLVK